MAPLHLLLQALEAHLRYRLHQLAALKLALELQHRLRQAHRQRVAQYPARMAVVPRPDPTLATPLAQAESPRSQVLQARFLLQLRQIMPQLLQSLHL